MAAPKPLGAAVYGTCIVGAGPSGLAAAARFRASGVPFFVIEQADVIAPSWRTVDPLEPFEPLELPSHPFPPDFPRNPTKAEYVSYLEACTKKLGIEPLFNERVVSLEYNHFLGVWWVVKKSVKTGEETRHLFRWLVMATGPHPEITISEIEGLRDRFSGKLLLIDDRNTAGAQEELEGKRVLVVGLDGNSGVDLSLHLADHNAVTFLVCRAPVGVVPSQDLGKTSAHLKWLSASHGADKLRQIFAWLLKLESRPSIAPLEGLNTLEEADPGGVLSKIRSRGIKLVPGIKRFSRDSTLDGETLGVDAVVLATAGHHKNVRDWIQESELFDEEGKYGWKGKGSLYGVGLGWSNGLSGAFMDAEKVAEDIGHVWKEENKLKVLAFPRQSYSG